jgi:quinol monooxygenase YgiN
VLESLEESTFVEIFAWRDAAAVESAHHDPKVRAVWDQMTPLCEARDGRPPMEFPHFKEI